MAPSTSSRTISGISHHFFSCLQNLRNSLNNDHMLASTLRFKLSSLKVKVQSVAGVASDAAGLTRSNTVAREGKNC
jgi:hypothetical protein